MEAPTIQSALSVIRAELRVALLELEPGHPAREHIEEATRVAEFAGKQAAQN